MQDRMFGAVLPQPPAGTLTAQSLTMADGHTLTVWHWPEQAGKPRLHWAHATGFNGLTYQPLLNRLAQEANVSAWDMRGHGHSHAAGHLPSFFSWKSYYRDLCSMLEQSETPLFLAGHSVGAIISLMAAAHCPDKVLGVLLVEPVILGRRARAGLALASRFGQSHKHVLAAGAARRRAEFPSKAEALARYRGRGAFRSWPDEWLEAYVEHGFVETPTGVRLACAPAWESASFAATEYRPWRGIKTLRSPALVLAGARDSTFAASQRQRMARLRPDIGQIEIPGTSHFLPMERPDAVVDGFLRLQARVEAISSP